MQRRQVQRRGSGVQVGLVGIWDQFEEKERSKIGNFGKHASTLVSITASSETLVQAEGASGGGVSHCREGGL